MSRKTRPLSLDRSWDIVQPSSLPNPRSSLPKVLLLSYFPGLVWPTDQLWLWQMDSLMMAGPRDAVLVDWCGAKKTNEGVTAWQFSEDRWHSSPLWALWLAIAERLHFKVSSIVVRLSSSLSLLQSSSLGCFWSVNKYACPTSSMSCLCTLLKASCKSLIEKWRRSSTRISPLNTQLWITWGEITAEQGMHIWNQYSPTGVLFCM